MTAQLSLQQGFGKMTENNITLKSALLDDAKNIAMVEGECLNVAWSEKSIYESISSGNYKFFIASDKGKTVGSGGIMILFEEAEITNIAVLKDYRRCGIASMLLSLLLDEAFSRGCESAFLEVAKNNVPALKLYEKFGFEKINVRKNYYKDPPDDAIIMKKTLK
jgi:ribosomal-protein-alanine N-acetyltransferase